MRSSASRTRRRRFVVGHGTAGNRFEELRELIHQPMPQRAKRPGVHRERRPPAGIVLHTRVLCRGIVDHRMIPSKRSVSRARPPFTVLNTR